MAEFHIAQVNIGRINAALDDPIMSGFVENLNKINELADNSPGFVWRLRNAAGNATYLRPYDDDRVLFNMSVWETTSDLTNFVYRTVHIEMLKRREEWFAKFAGAYVALWWVPKGHLPGVDEAKKRLASLNAHGPTQFAFTLKKLFPADEQFQRGIDWSVFQACPALS